MKPNEIMIVAGEASGDKHAARLVEAIRSASSDEITFFGAGRPRLRESGVEPVVIADELSIVGILEIGRALPIFLKARRTLLKAAKERRPSAVVLVDFPEFNLKLARSLKRLGIKVIYYISPQLWAWRQYRLSTVKKYVDLMLAILPFEKAWYAERGFDGVEFVGNPLAGEVHASRSREQFCTDNSLDPNSPIVALLPGSRSKEIARIYPVMLEAAQKLAARQPAMQFVAAAPTAAMAARLRSMHAGLTGISIRVVVEQTYDALHSADAAAVTSGTATLEAGIIGTPMAIVYKTSGINYTLLEPLIDVEHYGLVNLIAEERVAAELIQHDLTPETLYDEITEILEPKRNEELRIRLAAVKEALGEEGASERAAAAILRSLGMETNRLSRRKVV